MERENHENLLQELLDTQIEHSRKTEILQELRNDYNSVLTDFDELTQTRDKLKKDNDDLIISNSKLFREVGTQNNTQQENEDQDQAEFSETVTLEELEGDN